MGGPRRTGGSGRPTAALLAPGCLLVAGLLVAGLLTGCGSATPAAGSSGGAPAVMPSASAPPTCPPPAASAAQWPLAVPANLPKPPGAAITATSVQGTTTLVRFTTPTSLRESVLFVVSSLRKAGYTLGRGDAEPSEADAPFTGPNHVGAWRMFVTAPCSTSWVLAVQLRSGPSSAPLSPTLLPYTPGAAPAPLPTG